MRRPDLGQATAQRNMTTLYQNAHSPERVAINTLKYIDVLVVVVAAIPALLLGAPAFGFVVGAAAWIVQRGLQAFDLRQTAKIDESLRRAGIRTFEAFGRIWLMAGAIVLADLVGGRKDGLTAALVICFAYSVAFVIRLMSGPPPERESTR
jgi:hypothetical protein